MVVVTSMPARKVRWLRRVVILAPEGLLVLLAVVGVPLLLAALASTVASIGAPLGLDGGVVAAMILGVWGLALWWRAALRLAVPLSRAASRGGQPTGPTATALLSFLGQAAIGGGLIALGVLTLLLRPSPYPGWLGGSLVVVGVVLLGMGRVLAQGGSSRPAPLPGIPRPIPPRVARWGLALLAALAFLLNSVGLVNWFIAELPSLIPAYTVGRAGSTDALAFSPDGQRLATLGHGLSVWDVATRQVVWQAPCDTFEDTIEWSADGSYLAADCPDRPVGDGSGSYYYAVDVFDAATGARVANYPETGDTSVPQPSWFAWGPAGARFAVLMATTPETSAMNIFDNPGGKLIRTMPLPGPTSAYTCSWSPDGQTFALVSGDDLLLVSASTGQEIASYPNSISIITTLAWSPDSAELATAGWVDSASDPLKSTGQLDVWQVASGQRVFSQANSGAGHPSVAWSPDGRAFAVGSPTDFGVVQVYDASTWRVLYTWRGQSSPGGIQALAWSPDGRYIASGTYNGPIAVWQPVL